MAKQKNASKEQPKEVDTATAKPMYKITAEALQGLEYEYEYDRLYGWIHKGDVDSTLKAILKELVRIRMGGGHV